MSLTSRFPGCCLAAEIVREVRRAAHIRQRDMSPVEVVDAFIDRIEQRDPSINAFVYKGFDDARDAARQSEHAVASGAELGPLHGVPTALKDLFDFKPGWPATFGGIRALSDFSLDMRCVFAERVERAGAIILGKCNRPPQSRRQSRLSSVYRATTRSQGSE